MRAFGAQLSGLSLMKTGKSIVGVTFHIYPFYYETLLYWFFFIIFGFEHSHDKGSPASYRTRWLS
jgi:hypothetical protein